MKRKLADFDSDYRAEFNCSSPNRCHAAMETDDSKRQDVLDMSMVKLRGATPRSCNSGSGGKRTEPSLRRSVLIFNTLRSIEQQLRREGVRVNPAAKSAATLQQERMRDDFSDTLDPPPPAATESTPSCQFCFQPPCEAMTSLNTPCASSSSSLLVSSAVTLALTGRCRDSLVSQAAAVSAAVAAPQSAPPQHSSMEVCQNSSYQSSCHSSVSCQSADNYHQSVGSALPQQPSHGQERSFTSLLFSDLHMKPMSEKDDVSSSLFWSRNHHCSTAKFPPASKEPPSLALFEDLELGSLSDSPSGGVISTNMKLTPLSSDDLVQVMPGSDPFSFTTNFSSYKNDVLSDDLDHIMQVLIGI